jgi:hypothetical protein
MILVKLSDLSMSLKECCNGCHFTSLVVIQEFN